MWIYVFVFSRMVYFDTLIHNLMACSEWNKCDPLREHRPLVKLIQNRVQVLKVKKSDFFSIFIFFKLMP